MTVSLDKSEIHNIVNNLNAPKFVGQDKKYINWQIIISKLCQYNICLPVCLSVCLSVWS